MNVGREGGGNGRTRKMRRSQLYVLHSEAHTHTKEKKLLTQKKKKSVKVNDKLVYLDCLTDAMREIKLTEEKKKKSGKDQEQKE